MSLVEREKHCLRGRGSGPHIQGACLILLMSSSLLLLGGLLKAHPHYGSEFFPSPGGCKKSFVIWQKFCDYGRDHCETFSELVHINDFKGLWVSKMRQLKKSKDSIDPKKIWKLTKSLFYVYLIHSVSIHFILISISWGINFIHVSLVLWKYQYQIEWAFQTFYM